MFFGAARSPKRPCLAKQPVEQDAFVGAAGAAGLLERGARRQRDEVEGLVAKVAHLFGEEREPARARRPRCR